MTGDGGFSCNDDYLQIAERNPLEPGITEFKPYLPDAGFIVSYGVDEPGEQEGMLTIGTP